MIIRDYLSCKDRTFLWKCSSLLKNLYLCPFEYEKLLIKNLIKEMKEQIQKKKSTTLKALRWGVLVLVGFHHVMRLFSDGCDVSPQNNA